MSAVRRPVQYLAADYGFSLVELVVVIAILAILSAIALPLFVNIQKDARIRQAQNSLVSLIKECRIAMLRDEDVSMASMGAAKASMASYEMASQGNSADLGKCQKHYDGRPYIVAEALPTDYTDQLRVSDYPSFAISYYIDSGEVFKECVVETYTKYKDRCNRSDFSTTRRCVPDPASTRLRPLPPICSDVPNQAYGDW